MINMFYGSAEVVGLMCLKVFCNNDDELFQKMREPAKARLRISKVNFKEISEVTSVKEKNLFTGAFGKRYR